MATKTSEKNQKNIRSCVEKVLDLKKYSVNSKYSDVDKEDVITYVELLVESEFLDPARLDSLVNDPFPHKSLRHHGLRILALLCEMKYGIDFRCTQIQHSARKRINFLRFERAFKRRTLRSFGTVRFLVLLSKLESLEGIDICRATGFPLCEVLSRLPNLKRLHVSQMNPFQLSQKMRAYNLKLPNLKYLDLRNYRCHGGENLGKILFDVLPALPNLQRFRVSENTVESLQGIADRIRNNTNNECTIAAKSRLRRLDLTMHGEGRHSWLAIFAKTKLKKDPKEIEALKTILTTFRELNEIKGLFCLESLRKCHEDLDGGISYLMELNFTGRILVEAPADQANAAPPIQSSIPPSVWPIVLTRTWKQERSKPVHEARQFVNADGIYYLLQNVQLLQQRNNRNPSRKNKS